MKINVIPVSMCLQAGVQVAVGLHCPEGKATGEKGPVTELKLGPLLYGGVSATQEEIKATSTIHLRLMGTCNMLVTC